MALESPRTHFYNLVFLPLRLVAKALLVLAALLTESALFIRRLPSAIRKNKTYSLLPVSQLPGFVVLSENKGGVENIDLPKIVGLSNGGGISINMPGDYLYSLTDVSFMPHSDFIRARNGTVGNAKLLRKEYDVLLPLDRDIVSRRERVVRLAEKKTRVHSHAAFNLVGALSHHWGHFIAQYYPKLAFLDRLPKDETIDLVIARNTDPHIKYLIKHELQKHAHIRLLEVDEDSEVMCDHLYSVSLGTLLGDDGFFPTPFAIEVSNSTIRFWDEKASELVPANVSQYRKIYLGRTGLRSPSNSAELVEYFTRNGFEEIFPATLPMEEKIRLFSEAKCIVGPLSSGFTNAIFSQAGTKILSFVNSWRYLDTLMVKFANYKQHDFWLMTGKDDDPTDKNSSYEINVDDLSQFVMERGFV